MNRPTRPRMDLSCSLAALVLLSSCTDGSSSAPNPAPASTPAVESTPEAIAVSEPMASPPEPVAAPAPIDAPAPAVAEPAAPSTPEPGAEPPIEGDGVFFVLEEGNGGLVRLGPSGRFERVRDRGHALARASDGSLYLVSGGVGSYRLEALSGSRPDLPLEPSVTAVLVRDLVVLPNGHTWVLGSKGLAHHDGAAWTVTPPQAVGGIPTDLLLDAEGTLWVMGRTTLHRHGPDGFEEVAIPVLDPPRLGRFVDGAEEGIAMLGGGRLLRLVGDEWTTLELDLPEHQGQGIATALLRRDGTVVGRKLDSPVLLVAPPGAPLRALDLAALGVPAGFTYAMAFEDSGRLWVQTSVGLAVVEPDLATLARWYPPGSIPALEGRVQEMHAWGTLPSLPEPGPVDGHVRGIIVAGGEPVAGARIEMCNDPARGSLGSMGTPCEFDAPEVYGGKTRPDGSFDLWSVPPKLYELAVQRSAGTWSVTDSSPCCEGMEPGKVLDLGKIEVGKRANTK